MRNNSCGANTINSKNGSPHLLHKKNKIKKKERETFPMPCNLHNWKTRISQRSQSEFLYKGSRDKLCAISWREMCRHCISELNRHKERNGEHVAGGCYPRKFESGNLRISSCVCVCTCTHTTLWAGKRKDLNPACRNKLSWLLRDRAIVSTFSTCSLLRSTLCVARNTIQMGKKKTKKKQIIININLQFVRGKPPKKYI
jgi:hypothetical protein